MKLLGKEIEDVELKIPSNLVIDKMKADYIAYCNIDMRTFNVDVVLAEIFCSWYRILENQDNNKIKEIIKNIACVDNLNELLYAINNKRFFRERNTKKLSLVVLNNKDLIIQFINDVASLFSISQKIRNESIVENGDDENDFL